MIRPFMRALLLPLLLLVLAAPAAQAAGTCTVTSVSLGSLSYSGTAVTTTGTVNYTCTRTSNGADGTPTTFVVTAGQGAGYASSTRNAKSAGNPLAYSLRQSSVLWGDDSAGLGAGYTVTAAFANGGITSVSGSFPFTADVAANLTPLASVTSYTDTVSIGGTCTTKKASPCVVTPATVTVTIGVPPSCSLLTKPVADLALAYTSFQSGPSDATSSFSGKCTNGTPFRMSIGPSTSGTLLGINYSLKLGTSPYSGTDISSTSTYNLAGIGLPVQYYVNAKAVAGQVGTCANGAGCLAPSGTYTLTLEY